MKKILFIFTVCFFLTCNLFAWAPSTGKSKIIEIVTSSITPGTSVKVLGGSENPENCPNLSYHSLFIPATKDNYKAILGNLLTAFAMNKFVDVYTQGCIGTQNLIEGVVSYQD